jgi:prephenate dehydratase
MEARECSDTALSAKIAAQSEESWVAGICSELAAELYWLNILDRKIQDQKNNTTRFAIIAPNDSNVSYSQKSHKISIIFEARDIPSSLHKCLWAFANNDINLTKIESLPSYSTSFSYHFWIDFSGNLAEKKVQQALDELGDFTSSVRIIWEY